MKPHSKTDRYELYLADCRDVHPTQKPIAVMLWCVGLLPDAATICDPYMGSGTTGVACMKAGRKFIGVEKEEKYFDVAMRRIEAAAKLKLNSSMYQRI